MLFSGSAAASLALYCQVELVLDNDDETLAELPAEVSVMRRVTGAARGST